MTPGPGGARGHRVDDHLGDAVIEAWAPDTAACLGEALMGLADLVAAPAAEPVAVSTHPLATSCDEPEEALVALLEEVIFVLDVAAEVPVRVRLAKADRGFAGTMEVVPLDAVELAGPAPKAVSYHGLEMRREEGGGWRCRVLIDL